MEDERRIIPTGRWEMRLDDIAVVGEREVDVFCR
jgi:hypothetical protein